MDTNDNADGDGVALMYSPMAVVALCRAETILLSPSGDVLVSRCRDTCPYPKATAGKALTPINTSLDASCCCDDKVEPAFCSPWSHHHTGGGLRGGAETIDERSIVPIYSFDYTHFREGGNDMVEDDQRRRRVVAPTFWHGVPRFLPSLAQVKIVQVSAHPLGSHVLMISSAGLLYSYGLNDYGQLGIGTRSQGSYVMTPTIVTPLVENGGKSITCAAGVSHSLDVVQTEDRRLERRSRSVGDFNTTTATRSSSSSLCYHQLYGFGRNNHFKLGLVSPNSSTTTGTATDDQECVVLPRRVSLNCHVTNRGHGIFAVAASAEHSMALVRRSSSEVQLYAWGHATDGALGLPTTSSPPPEAAQREASPNKAPSVHIVPIPTLVASMSRCNSSGSMLAGAEYPCSISLGPRHSLVLTSRGRCFAFGSSDDGALGLGPSVRHAPVPREISMLRDQRIASVSVGASHVVACTDNGQVLAWGRRLPSGLLVDNDENDIAWSPLPVKGPAENVVHCCAGFDSSVFIADTGQAFTCGRATGRLGVGEVDKDVAEPCHLFGGLRLWLGPTETTPPYSWDAPAEQPIHRRGKSVA
jgi:alpha-tubulin suppressor-like RCC1 family protein